MATVIGEAAPSNAAPPAAAPILEVRHVGKRFPGVVALDDVTIPFMSGEIHAIVGENGAGKSTLMKILAGAYIPDSGEIIFQGRRMEFAHPREAQQAGISIIYQELNLIPNLNVSENIFMAHELTQGRSVVKHREQETRTRTLLIHLAVDAAARLALVVSGTKNPAIAGFFHGHAARQPMCRPPLTEKSAPVA